MGVMGLNVDPLIEGPFADVPNTTQIQSFPFGRVEVNTDNDRRGLFQAGNVMRQFAIGLRVPTTGQALQIPFGPWACPNHVTQINAGSLIVYAPIFMAVGKYTTAGTLGAYDLIGDWGNSPYGSHKWGLSYLDQSYNVNTGGQTKESGQSSGVIPGLCYIWRPGVGIIGFNFSAFSYPANSSGPARWSVQNYWQEHWGMDSYWVCYGAYGPRQMEVNHLAAVDYLPGDYLVVEYFFGGIFSAGSASYSVGTGYIKGIVQIGGGTNFGPPNSMAQGQQVASNPSYNTQISLVWSTSTEPGFVTPSPAYPATTPSLITVDPRAGRIIRLGFDNPVGVIGPTIGPAVEGVDVTSVAAIDDTTIDLHLLTASQPPAAPIGAATNELGPEAPSGGAVSSDPTPPVPVAGAFTEDP
jgi:hypothetical protein